LPGGWFVKSDDPVLVQTVGPGIVTGKLRVRRSGRYEVWLSGSIGRQVTVRVGGQMVGAVEDELSRPPGWSLVATVALARGRHSVRVSRGGGNLRPGNGGPQFLGPLVLRAAGEGSALRSVEASSWRRLCRRELAWVEQVAARGSAHAALSDGPGRG
jgi:hypothetical protein